MAARRENPQAEAKLLSACMLADRGGDAVIRQCLERGLKSESFAQEAHGEVWQAIVAVHESGVPVDLPAVNEQLLESGQVQREELLAVADAVETTGLAPKHLKTVVDLAAVRQVQATLDDLRVKSGKTSPSKVLELIEEARDSLERARPVEAGALPFINLQPLVERAQAGKLEHEKPTVGSVRDVEAEGHPIVGHLFYAGRLNEVHAEPAVGKTNISFAIAARLINSQKHVLMLDPEDTPESAVRKLVAFRADPRLISEYFHYVHNPEPEDLLKAARWAQTTQVAMAIVDGLAEMLASAGVSENEVDGVLLFFRRYFRPLTDSGAAVVIADHVAKSTEGRGRWARGSGAKLGRYDGASYELRLGQAYGPDKAGFLSMVVSKDRNGGVQADGRGVAAEVHFQPLADGRTEVEIRTPVAPSDFRPTVIMDKVLAYLRENPGTPQSEIKKAGLGKTSYVLQALKVLESEGELRVQKAGPGKPTRYFPASFRVESEPEQTEL